MKVLLASLLLAGATEMSETPLAPEQFPLEQVSDEPLDITLRLATTGFVSRASRSIDTIVIHSSYNKLGGDVYGVENILAIFRSYGVSSHYLIDREGRVYQLVADKDISYHAGISRMPDGRVSVNRFSIGIELLNAPEDQYTEAQYESNLKLITLLRSRYPIAHIVGHGQIAPQRRSDPMNFDWRRVDATSLARR